MSEWDENKSLDENVAAMVAESFAKALAETPVEDGIQNIKAGTADAEQRIAALEYDRLAREVALFGGVLPRAVKHVVRDIQELFDLRDNALVVRNGQTMPGDPLTPLSIEVWLEEQRRLTPFLFGK